MSKETDRRSRAYRLRIGRPFVVLGMCYLLGIALAALGRILFWWQHRDLFGDASVGEVAYSFAVGFRFDQIPVLLILLPALLVFAWWPLGKRPARIVLIAYLTLTYSASLLIALIDIRYYQYFGTHLSFLAWQYVGDFAFVQRYVWSDPMVWPFLIGFALVVVVMTWILARVIALTGRLAHRYGYLSQSLWLVAALVLVFIGVRGRLDRGVLSWGNAYHSQHHHINQLGLNPVYAFGKAVVEEGGDSRLSYVPSDQRFPFVSAAEAQATTRELLRSKRTELWDDTAGGVARITQQPDRLSFRPNVIVLLMESWSARYTGALGCPYPVTPVFDSLSGHGLLLTRLYATGTRTSYGIAGTLCAFPALPGRSILKRYQADHPYRSLADILGDRGYTSMFVYGGDAAFDNMEGFLRVNGYSQVRSEPDFGTDLAFAKWGVPDHVLFDRTCTLLDSLPRPFHIALLTLSCHEPFALPDSSKRVFFDDSDSARVMNAHRYVDWALGRLVDSLSRRHLLDSTLVLLTADHTRYFWSNHPLSPDNHHIPGLLFGVGIPDTAVTLPIVSSQMDLVPTLMGILGGNYRHASWGRDVLVATDSGFAVANVAERCALIGPDHQYTEIIGGPAIGYRLVGPRRAEPDPAPLSSEPYPTMQRQLRRYLQLAEQLSTPVASNAAR